MQTSNRPSKIQLPFATSGTKNTIPVASQIGITAGAASYTDGFPPLTATPLASGGVPPSQADFNGIYNAITAIQQWQSGGGAFPYDSAWSTANSGYPKGAILVNATNDGYWMSTAENNTTNPDATDGTAANWIAIDNYGSTAVAGLTNANVTLTPPQYAKPIITLAGTLTGNVQIIFPTTTRNWYIVNNTTGNFTVTAKTASGTGVAIPQTGYMHVWGDGTNINQTSQYGTTPPQFDNSQKLITSAFLQRFGMQSSAYTLLTAATVLTAANAGATVLHNSASNFTHTLPAASAMPPGTRLELVNINTGNGTFQRAGADTIKINGTTSVTSIVFSTGDCGTLVSDGVSSYTLVFGTVNLFGFNQLYTDVTASRALSTNYTNNTNKPIFVKAWCTSTTATSTFQVNFSIGSTTVDQQTIINGSTATGTVFSVCGFVNPGQTYKITGTQLTLTKVFEYA